MLLISPGAQNVPMYVGRRAVRSVAMINKVSSCCYCQDSDTTVLEYHGTLLLVSFLEYWNP